MKSAVAHVPTDLPPILYCGVEVIPMEWIEKVHGIDEIIQAAIKVNTFAAYHFWYTILLNGYG